MYSVRKAVNYTRNNGKWKLHSCSFLDGKGYTRKFPTIEAAETFARSWMDHEFYNKPDEMGYIAYCTIYEGRQQIKRVERCYI